jgi:CrcB protein
MYKILLIGVAGLVGTLARYGLSAWVDTRWDSALPIGTVTVNLIGCFVIGVVVHLAEQQYLLDPAIRAAILVGLLGGFTTFSSYAVQTFNLLAAGQIVLAAANLAISNIAGVILVWAGYTVAGR